MRRKAASVSRLNPRPLRWSSMARASAARTTCASAFSSDAGLSSTLAFNPSSIPVSQRACAVSPNARRNTGLASIYASPVWKDRHGPPFEAAFGQANHFSCRLSKYLAAAAGSQSAANPNAAENARTIAMRVNMYFFYHAVTPVGPQCPTCAIRVYRPGPLDNGEELTADHI